MCVGWFGFWAAPPFTMEFGGTAFSGSTRPDVGPLDFSRPDFPLDLQSYLSTQDLIMGFSLGVGLSYQVDGFFNGGVAPPGLMVDVAGNFDAIWNGGTNVNAACELELQGNFIVPSTPLPSGVIIPFSVANVPVTSDLDIGYLASMTWSSAPTLREIRMRYTTLLLHF